MQLAKEVVTLLYSITGMHDSLMLHALPHANAPSEGLPSSA